MKDVRIIKGLQSQINTLLADAELLQIDIAAKQKERAQKIQLIEQLKKQITLLNGGDKPKVSEHALVRYFERVKGFNITEIEKEILSEPVLNMIKTLGTTGHYPNGDYSVVMKENTVTTII